MDKIAQAAFGHHAANALMPPESYKEEELTIKKLQSLKDYRDMYEDAKIESNTYVTKNFRIKENVESGVYFEYIEENDVDDDLVYRLLDIEEEVFSEDGRCGEEYMRDHLDSDRGIAFVLKDEVSGEIVGYSHMVPGDEAWLMPDKEDDDRYEEYNQDNTLYISDIALLEKYRKRSGIKNKLKKLFKKAKEEGYEYVALHTGNTPESSDASNSEKFQGMGFEVKWVEENWRDIGEDYDFLVLNLKGLRDEDFDSSIIREESTSTDSDTESDIPEKDSDALEEDTSIVSLEEVTDDFKTEEILIRDLTSDETIIQNLLELLISSGLGKKTVLVFDEKLGGVNSQYVLAVFEVLKKLKNKSKLGRLLENLVLITTSTDNFASELEDYLDKDKVDVFVFAREGEAKTFNDIIDKVKLVSIDEKDLDENAYYPLVEIVIISLVQHFKSGILDKIKLILKALNITARKDNNNLIFTILPPIEEYDWQTSVKRYANLKRFLRSA